MDTLGLRMDQKWKCFDIRAKKLGHLTVFENFGREWMLAGEFLENFRVGTDSGFGLLDDPQFEFAEQNR